MIGRDDRAGMIGALLRPSRPCLRESVRAQGRNALAGASAALCASVRHKGQRDVEKGEGTEKSLELRSLCRYQRGTGEVAEWSKALPC